MTESGESAYETSKHTKVKEEIKIEVVDKSLVDDKAKKLDAIAGKSLIEDKAGRPDGIADKSSYVFVGVLRGVAKNGTTIIERLEVPAISKTRVLMTFNLNNPALVSLPFASF